MKQLAGDWPEALPRYWCGDDAFETRFLEAMSLLAPEMERFLIAAVREGLALPGGEAMAAAGAAFLREEAVHSRVHHGFNRRLQAQGIDADAALAGVRRLSRFARRVLPAAGQLAVAAACEHLSAILSLAFLRAPGRARIRSGDADRLFAAHAREEIGHRALVFDVLRATGGGGWAGRAVALAAVSLVGLGCALRVMAALLAREERGLWWRGAASLLRTGQWVSPGRLLRHWMLYLQPGFHPSCLPEG